MGVEGQIEALVRQQAARIQICCFNDVKVTGRPLRLEPCEACDNTLLIMDVAYGGDCEEAEYHLDTITAVDVVAEVANG